MINNNTEQKVMKQLFLYSTKIILRLLTSHFVPNQFDPSRLVLSTNHHSLTRVVVYFSPKKKKKSIQIISIIITVVVTIMVIFVVYNIDSKHRIDKTLNRKIFNGLYVIISDLISLSFSRAILHSDTFFLRNNSS